MDTNITEDEIEDFGKTLYEAYNAWTEYGEAVQRSPEGPTIRILMKLVRHNLARVVKMAEDIS